MENKQIPQENSNMDTDCIQTICVIRSLKGAGKDPVQIKSRDTRPRNMAALKRHYKPMTGKPFY